MNTKPDLGKTKAAQVLWADKLYNAPDTEFDFSEGGDLLWGEVAVGKLVKGEDILVPSVELSLDEKIAEEAREKIARRLEHFITRKIAATFAPLIALREDETLNKNLDGDSAGDSDRDSSGHYLARRIIETLGVIPRGMVRKCVQELDQDARAPLRKCGVRFGQYMIYIPILLKPAPTRLRLILWAVFEGFESFPVFPSAGLVTLPCAAGMPKGYHWRAGYQALGESMLRIDMLERLADLIRDCDAVAGFENSADMLSITGTSLETFAAILRELGYTAEKKTRPKVAASSDETPPEESPKESETKETPPDESTPKKSDKEEVGSESPDQTDGLAGQTDPTEEVYYIFKRKAPDHLRNAGAPNKKPRAKMSMDKKFKNKKFKDKDKDAGAAQRDHKPSNQPDPDSPFAALQALRLKK